MEGKEILEALGLPADLDSTEKIVEAHQSKFISVDTAHEDEKVISKITGKITGSLTTEAKRLFDFEAADIKDKDLKTILKEGTTKLKAKIAELETATNNDERFTSLKKEHDAKMILFDQTKSELQKTAELLENEKKSANEKIKGFKIKSVYNGAKDKLPFADGVKDVEKIGFDAIFSNKYVIDLDEQDNPIVLDKTGKKIPSKQKAGEFLGLEDVLKMELVENGLDKKNNLPRTPVTFGVQQQEQNTGNQTKPQRQLNQRAVEAQKVYEKSA